ncbi:hypothetical protein GF342_05560 [Candidatus Woesearchaeota archaeon]|nr:hypothetical protein [Candidatus Woesearchaeota archaeon]
MSEITKDNIAEELQRDLEELEGRKTKKNMTKKKNNKKAKKETKESKKETKESKKEKESKKKTIEKKSDKEHTVTTPEKNTDTTPVDPEPNPEDELRSKRVFYGGIAIIIILFLALLFGGKYISADDPTGAVTYGGFEFVKDDTHWRFSWQREGVEYRIPLRFNPLEAETVPVKGVLDPKFNKLSPIYIVFDPNDPQSDFSHLSLGAGELSFNLVQALGKQIESACATAHESCGNHSIVQCGDKDKAVVMLKTASPTQITIQDTCITIQGEGMELLRGIDYVLYKWYGIIR